MTSDSTAGDISMLLFNNKRCTYDVYWTVHHCDN